PVDAHQPGPGTVAVLVAQHPRRGGAVGLEAEPALGAGEALAGREARRPPEPLVARAQGPAPGAGGLLERRRRLVERGGVGEEPAGLEHGPGLAQLGAHPLVVVTTGEAV